VRLSGLKLETSILESILDCLKRYYDTVTSDPWLLPTESLK